MPNAYKVLAQLNPSATTPADLYTVPSSTETVISSMLVANIGTASATYRVSVRPNGSAQEDKHFIAFNTPVGGQDTIGLTLGLTLNSTDVVTVFASNGDLSFNLFGTEIS